MIETLDKRKAEDQFYSERFLFSYSGLNKLLYSPSMFYKHYVLRRRVEKLDKHLIEGKLTHCLLLDEEKFSEQFVLSQTKLPSENPKKVVDRIYIEYRKLLEQEIGTAEEVLSGFGEKILEVLEEINLYQSLGTDAQRIEKIVTDENSAYFDYLKIRDTKNIVDMEMMQRAMDAKEAIRMNPKACELLGLGCGEPPSGVWNELYLEADLPGRSFGIKGILDNLRAGASTKTLYINDVKRTSKTIAEFPESLEYYRYWMQAVIYSKLVAFNVEKFTGGEKDWTMVFHFIVIDISNQVYCFGVTNESMREWNLKTSDVLDDASYHYVKRDFTLPRKFAEGIVVL